MDIEQRVDRMREKSGAVTSDDRLVAFIYLLIRDEIPAGVLETMISNNNLDVPRRHVTFTNGWLAEYAKDMAERLTS